LPLSQQSRSARCAVHWKLSAVSYAKGRPRALLGTLTTMFERGAVRDDKLDLAVDPVIPPAGHATGSPSRSRAAR